MARPPLPLGHHGEIRIAPKNGHWVAAAACAASRFREAADVWLGKIRERREDSTLDIYRHRLNKVVLPQLGELRLSECDVAQIDAYFSRMERMRRTVTHKDGSTDDEVEPHCQGTILAP